MQGKAASSAGMRRARSAASALLARRDRAARQPHGGPIGYSGRSCRWCLPGRRLCAHSGTPVLVPDTWSLRPPDEDQNTCDRRLPLVWRRCIHAATDTVVRRPHGSLPGDRLARLDHLARRRLRESGRGGSRAHIVQTTRRARTKLVTGRSDVTIDLAHARRHGPAPPYGAQCPKWRPVPTGMAPWYKVF